MSVTTESTVEVRMIARLKHGGIARAAEKMGSLKALAAYLGVGYQSLCAWGNFRNCPPSKPQGSWTEERLSEVDGKFRALIGQGLDDLFPEKLRNAKEWWKTSKTFERTALLAPEKLQALSNQKQCYYLDQVDDALDRESLRDRIAEILPRLSYRERKIIELRYGLGEGGESYTLEEVGHIFKVTAARVRQIEKKALIKLRQPKHSSKLIDFLEPLEEDDVRPEDISPITIASKKLKEAVEPPPEL